MNAFKNKLSKREFQCVYLAGQDLTLQETADQMNVSYYTAKRYRRIALRKLDCKTMGGAVYRAIRLNLVNIE